MSERRVPDLRVTDVTVEFGGLTALQGAHLTAEVGERTVILGPNGAGKTTLFNVIGGTIKPRSGRIEIRGHDVTGRSPRGIRRHGLARWYRSATSSRAQGSTRRRLPRRCSARQLVHAGLRPAHARMPIPALAGVPRHTGTP